MAVAMSVLVVDVLGWLISGLGAREWLPDGCERSSIVRLFGGEAILSKCAGIAGCLYDNSSQKSQEVRENHYLCSQKRNELDR